MDPMAAIMWLLLVQGSGPSSSAINTVAKYNSEETCRADATKIEKTFWAHTLCLPVCTGNHGVCR